MKDKTRFIYETRPLALAQNMVVGDKYRFTVLTPSLIRMEYSKQGVFEDRASQSVFFRDFPENDFSKEYIDFLQVMIKGKRGYLVYFCRKCF